MKFRHKLKIAKESKFDQKNIKRRKLITIKSYNKKLNYKSKDIITTNINSSSIISKEKPDEKNMSNIITIKIKITERDINKKIYLISKKNKEILKLLINQNIMILLEETKENKEIQILKNYNKFIKKGEFLLKVKLNSNLKKVINGALFKNCENISFMNFSLFDSNILFNLSYMFYNCKNLKILNLINFDTSQITDMKYMFYGCESLQEINLSSFNTTNVEDSSSMFEGCKSLINLDISSFNFIKIKFFENMFYECDNLENIIINNILYEQIGDLLKNYNLTIIDD